jgi:hypothetical protein
MLRWTTREENSSGDNSGADCLIDISPSGALVGPVGPIKQQLPSSSASMRYCAAAKRGADTVLALIDVAGRLFVAGGTIDLARVNQYAGADYGSDSSPAATVVDLPNNV